MESKESHLTHLVHQLKNPQTEISQLTLEKAKTIFKVLNVSKINREQLEGLCFHGIPDEINGLRSLCWKIFLQYLPNQPIKWEGILEAHHKTYKKYICEHFLPLKKLAIKRTTQYEGDPLNFSQERNECIENMENSKHEDPLQSNRRKSNVSKKRISFEYKKEDILLPLANKNSPGKKNIPADETLWDDISKDARRTRSGMDFFQKMTDFPLKRCYNKENMTDFEKESHMETLSRILFIYGKINPNIGYVQGMNEILAPIYYCFSQDQNPHFLGNAEADSFFCFSKLMMDLQGSFLKEFDDIEGGIQERIQYLHDTLQRTDKKLWDYLEKYGVNPQFYSLRWLMLLLTQEFEMIEVLRLWDTLLSNPKKLIYLNYICLAMIEQVRGRLLFTEEFAGIMELLQSKAIENFDKILPNAYKLYKLHAREDEIVHHIVFPL